MSRSKLAVVLMVSAALTTVDAAVEHLGFASVDSYLICARKALGKPVFRDPASLRKPPALGCPTSRVELLADLTSREETLVETEEWAFVYPTLFLRKSGPSPPPIVWKRLDLSIEAQNWTGIPKTRALTSQELDMVRQYAVRDTRTTPVYTHDSPDSDGTVKVEYLLRSTAVRLKAVPPESIVSIVGRPGLTARLVYGELRGGQYEIHWDSPLFYAWLLEVGFEDVDDGVKEILIKSGYGTSAPLQVMLTIFDQKGHELTRQSYCDFDLTWGYDATGLVCPIVAQEITLADARRGKRDLFVRGRDSRERLTLHRYSLREGRYVDVGEARVP
jgi:hypothetical protein